MVNKKKVIGIFACIAALALGTAAVTLAYFTDTDEVTNTFTVGKVGITLDEADVNPDGTEITGADRVIENKYHLLPGHTYVKDPTVHVDKDSESCYVYVKVENGLIEIIDDITIEDQIVENGWTLLTGTTDIYYKEYTASPGQDTDLIVFENFKVKGESVTGNQLEKYKAAAIKVTAYAIQKDGFGTAEEAWTTVDNKF